MSNKEGKRRKLSQEILGLFFLTTAIAVFFYFFLSITASSIAISYCDAESIILTEIQQWNLEVWIKNVSFAASVLLFIVLFLFLAGQKLAYVKEIISGIDALRKHRMDYHIRLEGNNELTELAESINSLSKTEKELQLKEKWMQEEKEGLIRTLSHDIRTPLTTILSYSEYMEQKGNISETELQEYLCMIQQKAQQIKILTDRLLDGGRILEKIEDGRFLMEQLVEEWESALEEEFKCQIDMTECPRFSGEFDIQELRRVFDNLASNVEKYAAPDNPVFLKIYEEDSNLVIVQKNKCRHNENPVESFKIGLESIRKIAEHYKGTTEISVSEQEYVITIIFRIL